MTGSEDSPMAQRDLSYSATRNPGVSTAVERATVKVRVVLSVEVDGQAWGDLYGSGGWPTGLRREVKDYIAHNTRESAAANEGAIISVEVV